MHNYFFEFYNPVKIISGINSLENLPHELEYVKAKSPLLITDELIIKAGLKDLIVNILTGSNIRIAGIVKDVPMDSSVQAVNKIATIYRELQCDSIIALGGGSVLDTAKGVNMLVSAEDTDDITQLLATELFKKPFKPLIAIPTTAGTGSEATMVMMIADPANKIKLSFLDYHLLPHVAILDPRMTYSLPPAITAITGMDALTHAIEAYSCLQKNPLSDAYAVAAIKLISRNIVTAIKSGKDENTRMNMANAALMAGIAFSNSMVGGVHSLGHSLGGVCRVPHGIAMAILLPYVMEYNMAKTKDHYGELLLYLADSEIYANTPKDQRAEKTIAVIRELIKTLHHLCGIPLALKDAGVKKEQFQEIARRVIDDGSLIYNPVEMEIPDVIEILEKAY
jgi:alcohol dehydrogenase